MLVIKMEYINFVMLSFPFEDKREGAILVLTLNEDSIYLRV